MAGGETGDGSRAPRIRNLKEKRLYSMPGVRVPPELDFLVAGQVNM